MKPCLLGVLSVFYLTAASFAAETFTGNDLHELCVSSNEKGDLACTSWITGFKAGLAAAQAMAEEKRPSPLCLPKQVTGDQARLIIVKFMKDFPNTLYLRISSKICGGVLRAGIAENFCPPFANHSCCFPNN